MVRLRTARVIFTIDADPAGNARLRHLSVSGTAGLDEVEELAELLGFGDGAWPERGPDGAFHLYEDMGAPGG